MNIDRASRADVLAALAHGKAIALSAYVLAAESAVVDALTLAADRGARVTVALDGAPYFGARAPGAANPNLETARRLRAHGASVHVSDPTTEPPMHLKAAVVDGRAFLDDRNWASGGPSTIVATSDPDAVVAISNAIGGHGAYGPDFALQKSAALALEADVIARASGDRIDVATESFGSCVVAAALVERARAGTRVRLEVSARVLAGDARGHERAAIARLEAAGVSVRSSDRAEKFAVAGDAVWLGSANATASDGAMLDWGVRRKDRALACDLADRFEAAWRRGTPIVSVAPEPYAPKSSVAVADVRAETSSTSSSRSVARYAAVATM